MKKFKLVSIFFVILVLGALAIFWYQHQNNSTQTNNAQPSGYIAPPAVNRQSKPASATVDSSTYQEPTSPPPASPTSQLGGPASP